MNFCDASDEHARPGNKARLELRIRCKSQRASSLLGVIYISYYTSKYIVTLKHNIWQYILLLHMSKVFKQAGVPHYLFSSKLP